MRFRLFAAVGVVAAFGAAGACALDIPDVIVEGGVDANKSDSSPPQDVNVPDVPIPQCDASCAPSGFTPVLFATDRSSACPSGMTTLDLAADPGAAPANACTCDCNITTQPHCLPATITHDVAQFPPLDGGLSCNSTGTQFIVDGGCYQPDGGGVNVLYAWEGHPYAPVASGSCTSNASANAGAVPSTASRLCVDSTCAGTCASQGNLKACVYAPGAVPCPSGFTQTHHAGTVSLACAACAACSVTNGQCEGTVTLYSDTACTTKIIDESMDGGCALNGSANGQYAQSLKYTPQLVGTTCNPGKAGVGTVSLAGEVTVCCP